MSDLTRFEQELKKSGTRYRPVICGEVVKIFIYNLNAPTVYKFKNGKYVR